MDPLFQLERRLQELIEVHLVNLLPGRKAEDVVAHQLAVAMKARLGDETKVLPSAFIIKVHPASASKWRQYPNLMTGLAQIVRTVAEESGITFDTPPAVTIEPSPALGLEEVQVTASYPAPSMDATSAVAQTSQKPAQAENDNIPRNAFLIIGGVKIFPLDASVINIGRRADNNLVIDDPRVSRYHAQIRAIRGKFVLFDLNSTGGTYVNGERTNQSILYPGDVISLSGLPVIFGQDNPPASYLRGDTAPISPFASERPTAILKKDEQK